MVRTCAIHVRLRGLTEVTVKSTYRTISLTSPHLTTCYCLFEPAATRAHCIYPRTLHIPVQTACYTSSASTSWTLVKLTDPRLITVGVQHAFPLL